MRFFEEIRRHHTATKEVPLTITNGHHSNHQRMIKRDGATVCVKPCRELLFTAATQAKWKRIPNRPEEYRQTTATESSGKTRKRSVSEKKTAVVKKEKKTDVKEQRRWLVACSRGGRNSLLGKRSAKDTHLGEKRKHRAVSSVHGGGGNTAGCERREQACRGEYVALC